LNLVRFRIAELCVVPGVYSVGLWAADGVGQPYDYIPSAFDLEVVARVDDASAPPPAFGGLVPSRFQVSEAEPVSVLPETR
jgi:hypothetical protein